MNETFKSKKIEKILSNQQNITGINDLTAGDEPSLLFYILADKLGYLLENNPDKVLSKKGVEIRKKVNYIIKKLGPAFLTSPQIIENRKVLLNPNSTEKDDEIVLPDKPVIWVANHAFKDDTLASILAIKRNAYILFGSLPQFYNTFDGITAWLNGVVMTNRKHKDSKKASIKKAVRANELGSDLFIFPEGVWNKSPNELLIDFWPGIYRIAKETGADIIPVVHYQKDTSRPGKDNLIHTVVDNPINISGLTEEEGLELIRDKISTWYYLMMERYGQTTREELLEGYDNSKVAWEEHLKRRVSTADRYDEEIELSADYRPKKKVRAEDVYESIANIDNITPENVQHVLYARQLVKERKNNDFQRRF